MKTRGNSTGLSGLVKGRSHLYPELYVWAEAVTLVVIVTAQKASDPPTDARGVRGVSLFGREGVMVLVCDDSKRNFVL